MSGAAAKLLAFTVCVGSREDRRDLARLATPMKPTDMDTRGARHLAARLAAGAAVGARVEAVSVTGDAAVQPGATGTLVSIEEGVARVVFDTGAELEVDPKAIRPLPALRRSA